MAPSSSVLTWDSVRDRLVRVNGDSVDPRMSAGLAWMCVPQGASRGLSTIMGIRVLILEALTGSALCLAFGAGALSQPAGPTQIELEAAGHARQTAPEVNIDSALRRFASEVFRWATWLFLTAMDRAFLLPMRTARRLARVSAV